MRDYRFLTCWLLAAPREAVFDAVWLSERWPEWWPGVVAAVETDPGDPVTGIGRRGSYEWRSRIPYPVRFDVVATRVERPWLLEGAATGGMVGTGRWRLFAEEGAEGPLTAVLYEWNVRPTAAWMRALTPIAAPLLRWNHDLLMRRGAEGLARLIGARLLAA